MDTSVVICRYRFFNGDDNRPHPGFVSKNKIRQAASCVWPQGSQAIPTQTKRKGQLFDLY